MLIKTSYRDVPTSANGRAGSIRIYIVEPNVPEYPEAKFPGCVVFSEIYQVTGPVERYVACAFRLAFIAISYRQRHVARPQS